MSEKEMNAYRFSSGQEPSDAMLGQLMKEAAQEAHDSNQQALYLFFDSLEHEAAAKEQEWKERINRLAHV